MDTCEHEEEEEEENEILECYDHKAEDSFIEVKAQVNLC
mgnify:FL=1|jgi:hypothetical protein